MPKAHNKIARLKMLIKLQTKNKTIITLYITLAFSNISIKAVANKMLNGATDIVGGIITPKFKKNNATLATNLKKHG